MDFRQNSNEPSELVIGLIGPIGCNRKMVIETISRLAIHYSYRTEQIRLSEIIKAHVSVPTTVEDEYARVSNLMSAGNALRTRTDDDSILAKLAAVEISKVREHQKDRKVIYIIDSLKRPEEIDELRNIYGEGFYLFAIHSAENLRDSYLQNQCSILDEAKRKNLIERDKDEKAGHGQSTSEAFHLADFFLAEDGNNVRLWNSTKRFFDIIFGHPFKTPTFHEYSMFMAYAASMRSADLSRQVGAVITHGNDILSTGANECPKPTGGTYWPLFKRTDNTIYDAPLGRDYMNGIDRNGKEKQDIIDALKHGIPEEVLSILERNIKSSGLKDITEYGRVVHAEMDAILGCAKRGISCQGAVIFCTTYPCHNCAKHIIASGIKKVLFIEPYPKSKAFDMHRDAIRVPGDPEDEKVLFIPFVGVGPRQFVNLFSLTLSRGEKITRKEGNTYKKANWERKSAKPRVKNFPISYIEGEKTVETEAFTALGKAGPITIAE